MAQKEPVFFAVDLADPFAAKLANFLVEVVALFLHVGHVVIDLYGRRVDGVEDSQVIVGAQPTFKSQDHAGCFGLGSHTLQPPNHGIVQFRLPLDVSVVKEGH